MRGRSPSSSASACSRLTIRQILARVVTLPKNARNKGRIRYELTGRNSTSTTALWYLLRVLTYMYLFVQSKTHMGCSGFLYADVCARKGHPGSRFTRSVLTISVRPNEGICSATISAIGYGNRSQRHARNQIRGMLRPALPPNEYIGDMNSVASSCLRET